MMNFIAAGLVSYLTQYHYRKVGDPILETLPIAERPAPQWWVRIPRMSAMLALRITFPDRLPLNLAFLLLWPRVWPFTFSCGRRNGWLRAVGTNPAVAGTAAFQSRATS
jgi:simple sugar transport system permease protein